MLSTQNKMIFFNMPLMSQMFHFLGKNLWLTVASLASMQFPKDTGFDKRKVECYGFS